MRTLSAVSEPMPPAQPQPATSYPSAPQSGPYPPPGSAPQPYPPQAYPPQAYPPQSPGGPYPTAQPAPAYPQVLLCRVCACGPAAKATFRGHRGMILLMQFRSVEGPFCRDCGVAAFRQMSADTMWQGWWGVASFFITPVVLLINLFPRNRVTALAPPQPNPWGTSRRPLSPGRPLMLRPGALVGLIPTAAFVILVFSIALAIITDS